MTTTRTDIDIPLLRKLIAYDPDTGVLTWLPRTGEMFKKGAQTPEHNAAIWNSKHAGKPALASPDIAGNLVGGIFGKTYQAHRVAWALYHGEWPERRVTHKNGNHADNRAVNLKGTESRRRKPVAVKPTTNERYQRNPHTNKYEPQTPTNKRENEIGRLNLETKRFEPYTPTKHKKTKKQKTPNKTTTNKQKSNQIDAYTILPMTTLRKLIAYDPENGALTWLPRSTILFNKIRCNYQNVDEWNAKYVGTPVFLSTTPRAGLVRVINGVTYQAHSVAWALYYNKWPTDVIWHKNKDKTDNRIANLSETKGGKRKLTPNKPRS